MENIKQLKELSKAALAALYESHGYAFAAFACAFGGYKHASELRSACDTAQTKMDESTAKLKELYEFIQNIEEV